MKPYRNIYIRFEDNPVFLTFNGQLEIQYTGKIVYGVTPETLPKDYDPEQDIYYQCHCDLEEFSGFKKVLPPDVFIR